MPDKPVRISDFLTEEEIALAMQMWTGNRRPHCFCKIDRQAHLHNTRDTPVTQESEQRREQSVQGPFGSHRRMYPDRYSSLSLEATCREPEAKRCVVIMPNDWDWCGEQAG
jgi:hypothetical protein